MVHTCKYIADFDIVFTSYQIDNEFVSITRRPSIIRREKRISLTRKEDTAEESIRHVQSRATDTHLILRPHEETDCLVLDAVVRSWLPIQPRVLRWTFPVWTLDDSFDPAALRVDRPRRKAKTASESDTPPKATEPAWDALRFVAEFVTETPVPKVTLVESAAARGLSERRTQKLLKQAEGTGLIHRWKYGSNQPVRFARIPQTEVAS
jgi:hypothetical protein